MTHMPAGMKNRMGIMKKLLHIGKKEEPLKLTDGSSDTGANSIFLVPH